MYVQFPKWGRVVRAGMYSNRFFVTVLGLNGLLKNSSKQFKIAVRDTIFNYVLIMRTT